MGMLMELGVMEKKEVDEAVVEEEYDDGKEEHQ